MSIEYLIGLIITALAVVIWWVVRKFASQVIERLDMMVKQNAGFGQELVKLKTEQNTIIKTIESHHSRLNDHALRLRSIELHNASCKFNKNTLE